MKKIKDLPLSERPRDKLLEKGLNFKSEDIIEIDGIGKVKATAISAAIEFVRW